MTVQTVAAAVIVKDGRVILQQRAVKEPGFSWCFPGGVVEDGETLEIAVVREILEECGVTVKPGRILGEKHVTRGTESFRVVYMLCDHLAGEPEAKEPRESISIEWIDMAMVPSLVERDYMPFIHDYFQTLKGK